jgi:hypothetical protein
MDPKIFDRFKSCPVFFHQEQIHGIAAQECCVGEFMKSIEARDKTIELLVQERDDLLYQLRKKE